MSLPTGLLLSRYRSFAGEVTLPLRPLTLLYGRNNAGKSALARALAIIAASVEKDPRGALQLPPEIVRDSECDFRDLAWRGDGPDYNFDLGLQWKDGTIREVRYSLDVHAGRPAYIKALVLRDEQGETLWAGEAAPYRPIRHQSKYSDDNISFAGLVPREPHTPELKDLAMRMEALRGHVRWLHSVRTLLQRQIKRTGNAPAYLLPDGSNADKILVERPELIENVARFYARLNPARELTVKEVLDVGHRMTLNPKNSSGFQVDIVDTGEGMQQVLPVLVAAALTARDGSSGILVAEEPESHLHPDAQTTLARHLCEIAATNDPPTLVLETHSRVFLLGVQLAVAEGRLPCDRVVLAWIEQDALGRSTITPVDLSPSGHPRAGWPIHALGEDLRLASELARRDLESGLGD